MNPEAVDYSKCLDVTIINTQNNDPTLQPNEPNFPMSDYKIALKVINHELGIDKMNSCKDKTGLDVHELYGLYERILAKTLAVENTQCVKLIELDCPSIIVNEESFIESSDDLLGSNNEEIPSYTVLENGSIWEQLLGKELGIGEENDASLKKNLRPKFLHHRLT